MKITGGRLKVTEINTEDCATELPPHLDPAPTYPPASGTILYASMTVKFIALPTPAGDYFAHFSDGTTSGFRARVSASRANAGANRFRFGIANNSASVNAAGQIATDIATNQNQFLVVRFAVGTGESRLWLNPLSEASPSVAANDAPAPLTIQNFVFRQSTSMGTMCVDDLRIGTAFKDVVGPYYPLTVQHTDNNVQVCWPVDAVGYQLQFTDEVSPANWMDATDPVTVQGSKNVVTYPGTTGHKSFRLYKP